MTLVQSIVLGIIQGISEFLPISSSGHLILAPYLFGWDLQDLSFDVALHLGTAFAVLFFFKDIWYKLIHSMILDGLSVIKTKSLDVRKLRRETIYLSTILIVTIPVAIVGMLLESTIEETFRSPIYVAIMLILISFVMYIADLRSKSNSKDNPTFVDSLIISISQIVALFPGSSRSGVSISSGLFRGLTREKAAEYSFLLATPIIVGAGLLKLPDLISSSTASQLGYVFVGFLTSFITGLLSIKFLLKFLKTKGLNVFIVYRITLGIIILVMVR